MQDYLELERTLKQTLISAQKTSGDMKDNAEKQADLIVKQAELQAERILDEARSESEAIGKEIRDLKRQRRMLKVELRTVLESYLSMLNEESPTLGHNSNNVEPLEKPIEQLPIQPSKPILKTPRKEPLSSRRTTIRAEIMQELQSLYQGIDSLQEQIIALDQRNKRLLSRLKRNFINSH